MAESSECLASKNSDVSSNLSHRQKKALLKKQKRKLKRIAAAQERDEHIQREEEIKKNSPNYCQRLVEEEEQERAELLQIEAESRRQCQMWEWHEEVYKQKLKEKEEQKERERLQKIEIEKKIKEEWEERQKKEKEEEEERKKKKDKQVIHQERWTWITLQIWRTYLYQEIEELLKQAREAENKDGDWSNPLAPVQYGKERQIQTCPFFLKVAACRFGDRCSRGHPYPETSRTLLFSSMFRHFQLDQGLCEEYDTDIVLEYEDSEVYQKFKEFYEDVLPEFKAIGPVVQFKVCCNFQPHLRGNVYVSYSREDHALEAYAKFNARWYGGKQISAQFVDIPSWRRAICGLFGKGRCPKGNECNFMHVFRNPSSEFNLADRDAEPFTPRQNSHQKDMSRSRDRYSPSKSSRKSREKHRSHRSDSKYSRNRSRSRDRNRSYSSRQRSRSPYRSHSSRQRSRSPHRPHSSRQRSRSPSDRSRKSRKKSRSPNERSKRSRSPYYRSNNSRRSNSPCKRSEILSIRRSKSYESDSSSRENTPEKKRKRTYKKGENNSENNSEHSKVTEKELVWVEKTKETVSKGKPSYKVNKGSSSVDSSDESDSDDDDLHKSNCNS